MAFASVVGLGCLVALSWLFVSCGKRSDSKTALRVGYMGFASDLPLYVANRARAIPKYGLSVELAQFTRPTTS